MQAGVLEALPIKLKRETNLAPEQMKIVEREIIEAQNVASEIKPDWSQIDVASNS